MTDMMSDILNHIGKYKYIISKKKQQRACWLQIKIKVILT